jgi:eukaryotic-like serine/threonine-protein kinase
MTPVHAPGETARPLPHRQRLVARSGMASIFRATDLQRRREVAIKVPHPEMECDPVLFDRFQREADRHR